MNYVVITTQEDLDFHCKEMSSAGYLAIDTEFMRHKTYYPQLCLLQICYKEDFAIVIDVLQPLNLEEILNIIYDDKIVKVFHGGRQDLEIFYHLKGALPQNVFDTQLAVMTLNYAKDLSYAALVKFFLDYKLDKSEKISNWYKRPLAEKQFKYAAYDVLFLYKLYKLILDQIISYDRQHILKDIFAPLLSIDTYEFNVKRYSNKIINYSFSPEAISITKELLLWREQLAKKLNLARNFIINSDKIKLIATSKINACEDLLAYVDQEFFDEYGKEIFEVITNSLDSEVITNNVSELKLIPKIMLNPQEQELLFLAQLFLKAISNNKAINPLLLASNDDLIAFVKNPINQDIAFLKGWRYEIFGSELLRFFTGKKSLSIIENKIVLQ